MATPLPLTASDALRGRRIRVVGSGTFGRWLTDELEGRGAILTETGLIDALVFAPWDRASMVATPFEELTDADFEAAWQRTMDDAIAACIDARGAFEGSGGTIVLTFPTTGLVGGAHFVHWAAAAEGVHILARSLSRQWGPEGIAVNALAIDPNLVLDDAAAAGPVSIAMPANPDADLIEVLAMLTSPTARHLAGQTLTVDGGLWM